MNLLENSIKVVEQYLFYATLEESDLRISEREHTFESFIGELLERGIEPGERLRIVCYIARRGDWKTDSYAFPSLTNALTSSGVEIKELGEIRKLVMHYRDLQTDRLVPVTYFAFLHRDTSLLMCFTDGAKYDVEQTFDKIIERTSGLYFAFIGPSTIKKIQDMLFQIHPTTLITYFSAYRHFKSSLRSEIRPEYQRTIEYRGNDGAKVLEELKLAYGVLPRTIHFETPDFATYHIHNVGHFTLAKGEENARRFMLEIVDLAMKDVLITRKIVESADFELIPMETQTKTFLFPKLKPWLIRFSTEIDVEEGQNLIDILEDNEFEVFSHVLAKGSLRLNGLVADRLKKNIFTVDANSERMVIAPLKEVPFDSFLRLYQVVVENFDPNAECQFFEQERKG